MEPNSSHYRMGQGKISGTISIFLALLSLGAVICFHYPSILTTPQLREVYPIWVIRALIATFISLAYLLGLLSIILNPKLHRSWWAISCALLATLLGGPNVEYEIPVKTSNYLGLDWFILDLLLLSSFFIPLERRFGRTKEQLIFRFGWKTDLSYFFINHVLVQVVLYVTMIPALLISHWVTPNHLQNTIRQLPIWAQLIMIIFIIDFIQYWIHRAFHKISWLWPIHAVHHSTEVMDWLAGSRLHLFDILLTRGLTLVPLIILNFSVPALQNYLVFAAIQTVWIHSNIRFRFDFLFPLISTPPFHHWHHSSEKEALDKNFSVHLPLFDWLFGTLYMPKETWPLKFGLDRELMPENLLKQFLYPFKSRKSPSTQ